MKRFLPLVLCCLLLLTALPTADAASAGTVRAAIYNYVTLSYEAPQDWPAAALRLDGEPLEGEMPGVILGGRTLAPLRSLAEALGAEVEWLPDAAQVRVSRGEDVILLTLGSTVAQVNGQARELPDGVPATTLFYEGASYTVVPLRFFSEALDCRVTWDQKSYTASVESKDYIDRRLAELTGPLDAPAEPERFLIILDPGHGGAATGAYYEETAEKDLNLAMARILDDILQGLGYRTLMTRQGDEDVGLYERAAIANRAQGDLFVSIHCNAAERHPDFQGVYVYHYPGSDRSEALAQSVQTAICAFTGAIDRGIEQEDFVVLRETDIPAVLVEAGFMTCHEELERLKNESYRDLVAQGIAQGVNQYLNSDV